MSTQQVRVDAESMRVGDAERQACVEALNQHFAEGRLPIDELDRRQHAALNASTAGDLDVLVADLPDRPQSALGQRRPDFLARRRLQSQAAMSRFARLGLPPVVVTTAATLVPAYFDGPSDVGLFAATLGVGVLGYLSHWAVTKKWRS